MESTSVYLFDRLVEAIKLLCSLVVVKYFLVLGTCIESLAKLEPVIFTYSIYRTILSQVQRVLESQRHLLNINLIEGLNDTRLLPVDIVFSS